MRLTGGELFETLFHRVPLFRRGVFDGVVDEPVEPKLLWAGRLVVVIAARPSGGKIQDTLQHSLNSMRNGPLTVALSRSRARPSGLENWPPVQLSWPLMWAPRRRTSPLAAKPASQNMSWSTVSTVSGEGLPVGVGELATRADELATDVGDEQAYLAGRCEAPIAVHVLGQR